jgi:hypothetical protein
VTQAAGAPLALLCRHFEQTVSPLPRLLALANERVGAFDDNAPFIDAHLAGKHAVR